MEAMDIAWCLLKQLDPYEARAFREEWETRPEITGYLPHFRQELEDLGRSQLGGRGSGRVKVHYEDPEAPPGPAPDPDDVARSREMLEALDPFGIDPDLAKVRASQAEKEAALEAHSAFTALTGPRFLPDPQVSRSRSLPVQRVRMPRPVAGPTEDSLWSDDQSPLPLSRIVDQYLVEHHPEMGLGDRIGISQQAYFPPYPSSVEEAMAHHQQDMYGSR